MAAIAVSRIVASICTMNEFKKGSLLVSYVGEGHGGLYKASTMEERRKQKARRERDQIKFIDLGFERWQVIRFRKARRQEVP